jgi:CubicO group peptidase (beta-lactamase class C family)
MKLKFPIPFIRPVGTGNLLPKKKKQTKFWVLFLPFFICFFTQCLQAQNREAALDSFFSTVNKNGDINGSVLHKEKGKIVFKNSFGYRDVANQLPNTENTVFQLASISKTFTSIAILQLMEKKKLRLNDKLAKYFPGFLYKEITILHLLSHTSGLPDGYEIFDPYITPYTDTVFTIKDIVPTLISRQLKLQFNPGEQWSYCNINFNLLALLIENITGMKYQEYLQKNVFIPAGMKSTFIKTSNTNINKISNIAYNYDHGKLSSTSKVRVDSFAKPVFKTEFKTIDLVGSTNVYSSTIDLAKYDEALYNGKLLTTKSLELAFTPVKLNDGKNAESRNFRQNFFQGLGWFILADTSMGKIVWHTGGVPGGLTMFMRNIDRHQMLAVLDNMHSEKLYSNAMQSMRILNGIKVDLPVKVESVSIKYGELLIQHGPDFAFSKLIEMKADKIHYMLDENELNEMAYEFFGDGKQALAFEVLRTAIFLFPKSDNLYNSYGELLERSGNKEGAIIMFKESLVLNPKNENSIMSLEKLEKK